MEKTASENMSPPPLPQRPADGHKGTFGRVLVIGGNSQMIGAPVLAGTAALRLGSGLVQIAVSAEILAAALSITPELIGLALDDEPVSRGLRQAVEAADAIIIGPGMGQSLAGKRRLRFVLYQPKPVVIDADALNLLAQGEGWPADCRAAAVLTPHPGEMSRLGQLCGLMSTPADDAGRQQHAAVAAAAFKQVVVLKGARTVISDGQRIHTNHTGDSTLAKAGAGDVLSGMIGCLLGQGMEPFDAAVAGVYYHGLAGQIAGKRLGQRCALARDVIDAIREAIRQ